MSRACENFSAILRERNQHELEKLRAEGRELKSRVRLQVFLTGTLYDRTAGAARVDKLVQNLTGNG